MFHLSLVLYAVDPAVGDVLTAVVDPAVASVPDVAAAKTADK